MEAIPVFVKHHLAISSKHRDLALYPDSATYATRLPSSIRDCVSMRIVSAIIPNAHPSITQDSCFLDIREWSDLSDPTTKQNFSIAIPIGNYEIESLSTTLSNAIGALTTRNVYTVAASMQPLRICIRAVGDSQVPFSILFGTGPNANRSLATKMGYKQLDTPYSFTCAGDWSPDLKPPPYVDVVVEEAPGMSCKDVVYCDPGGRPCTRRILTRIPMDVPYGHTKFFHAREGDSVDYISTGSVVGQLTVRLLNPDGKPFTTDGLNNAVVIELKSVGKRFATAVERPRPLATPGVRGADRIAPDAVVCEEPPNKAVLTTKYAFYGLTTLAGLYGAYKLFGPHATDEAQ